MLILYLKIKCGVNQIWCYQNYLAIPMTRRFPDVSSELLYDRPTSDIGYPIESDRRTALDKLYITQLLPIRYSINITNISAKVYEVVISLGNHSCGYGFEYCVEE